jgi:D-alanyl-lipoteichoic acid acyltransferase DltB (MBOAT superfamily)
MSHPDCIGDLYCRDFTNLDLPGLLMSIFRILILTLLASLIGLLRKGRSLALLGVSAVVVHWLTPPYDNLIVMYWLPTLTLVLAVLAWGLTAPPEVRSFRRNLPALAILAGASLLVSLNRYFKIETFFSTMTPPPQFVVVAWLLVLVSLVVQALILRRGRAQRVFLILAVLEIIILLVLVKSSSLTGLLYGLVISLRGVYPGVVPFSIQWLGFSYIAFRLLHTFFDRLSGRLPAVSLDEYVTYIIFFPALSAGPIDRIERFLRDLRDPQPVRADDWLAAGQRFFTGLFKKFVLADALALVSIDAFAPFVQAPGWAWLVLYAYAFRLLFDFSGYTDIAISMGRLVGIHLPENFASPYLKPNLTRFWNSWHMSLTQWFRAYLFNPLVRTLRSARKPLPAFIIIAIAQFATMLLIGLWHGITWNYILWGLWHALGLFIHNRWSEWTRLRVTAWAVTPARKAFINVAGILLTFHYVALGWVFFALTTPAQSWMFLLKLFCLS